MVAAIQPNASYSTTSIDSCSSAKTTASSLLWYRVGADGADEIAREWVLHKKVMGINIELITDPNYSSPAASELRSIYWGFKSPRSADAGLRRRLGVSLAPIKHCRRNASLELWRVPAVRLCSAVRAETFRRSF